MTWIQFSSGAIWHVAPGKRTLCDIFIGDRPYKLWLNPNDPTQSVCGRCLSAAQAQAQKTPVLSGAKGNTL